MDKKHNDEKKSEKKPISLPHVKTDIDFDIKSSRLKGILSIVLIVIMLIFATNQVLVLRQEDESDIKTQTAQLQTIYRNINTRGFVVREESVISGVVSSTVVPQVENGRKVSIGDTVARVYNSSEAAKKAVDVQIIEKEIEYYESISSTLAGNLLADINIYENNVLASLMELSDCIYDGNLSALADASRELRLDIAKKQIAVGGNIDVSNKLDELYAEYNALVGASANYTSITASKSGYFVNETDSLENIIDYNSVTSLLYDDVERLLSMETENSSSSLGKVITGFTWYLVCNISNDETDGIKVGSSMKVNFSEISSTDIKMKVVAMNTNSNGYTTVIFSSNEMSEDIATLRNCDVRIRAEEYTGYAININAVRTVTKEVDGVENNVVGVYVKLGNIVRFRKIEIVYSDENIILAYSKDGESGYIARYDEVITEGTDLYDGKIIS